MEDELKGDGIDAAIRFVRDHPWGIREHTEPQTAWPERDYEDDEMSYVITMLKQLFVELAELRTLVASQESERT